MKYEFFINFIKVVIVFLEVIFLIRGRFYCVKFYVERFGILDLVIEVLEKLLNIFGIYFIYL